MYMREYILGIVSVAMIAVCGVWVYSASFVRQSSDSLSEENAAALTQIESGSESDGRCEGLESCYVSNDCSELSPAGFGYGECNH